MNKPKTRENNFTGFIWQGHQDSNPEPMVLETTTLPIEPYPYINVFSFKMAGVVGLEPTTNGFGDRYSTN